MGLTTKCAKICPRENVTKGLVRENLAARKYLRSQYLLLWAVEAQIMHTEIIYGVDDDPMFSSLKIVVHILAYSLSKSGTFFNFNFFFFYRGRP